MLAEVFVGEKEFLDPAHAGADGHRQSARVDFRRPGVRPDPSAEHHSHSLHVRQCSVLLGGQLVVERLQQMTADADRQVELLDERVAEQADTASTVEQPLPGAFCVGPQGCCHGNPGHHYVRELSVGCHRHLASTNF